MPGPFAPDMWLAIVAAPFIGSFLGVAVARFPAGDGVVLGRSACPHCRRRLAPRDLVPIISWLLNRGRCRSCGAALGAFYPAIELAALAVALWAATELSGWLLWASCALGWALLALAAIDLRRLVLPDSLTLPLAACGLAVAWLVAPASLFDHALGAATGFATFALIAVAYRRLRGREGLGLGDAKLLAAAGAWVSWPGLAGVVLLAGSLGLALALARRLGGRAVTPAERIAFGPYLSFGTWVIWLYGPIVVV